MKQVTFENTEYTLEALEALTGGQLVVLHNRLAKTLDDSLVKRFADKPTAVKRTWALLEALPAPKQFPVEEKKEVRFNFNGREITPRRAKARTGTNIAAPGHKPIACRVGTKQSILLDMLARKEGASMEELMGALSTTKRPWGEAAVRSGFSWDMKQKGYGVRSAVGEDGVERFFLVVPEGFDIPPHRPGRAE